MRILVSCEESQAVTIELRKLGHEAYSCDLLPCSGGHPEWHIQHTAIEVLNGGAFPLGCIGNIKDEVIVYKWDMVIAHPPCTYLTNAGVRWLASKKPLIGYDWSEKYNMFINWNRYADMMEAIDFFNEFIMYGVKGNAIAIENPIMHSYAKKHIIHQSQIVHPYHFGHLETKATCLWLFNLPKLVHTNDVYDEMMKLSYAKRSKVHYASPGKDRAKIRSKTFPGIAKAIAEQWADNINNIQP